MRITAADYEPLKAFFAWMSDRILQSRTPVEALERFEVQSMARARQGLGMAIGDIVEMTEAFLPGQVAEIDAALAADGLITLSAARARFGRTIRTIVKRGRVRSEGEYYALRNAVDSMNGPEQAEAWRLLAEFEGRSEERRA